MPIHELKVLAFFNAFWQPAAMTVSGGDIRFIEIFKRLPLSDLSIATTHKGALLLQQHGLNARYLTTSDAFDNLSRIPAYIARTLSTVIRLLFRKVHILYATSDFFPDVIPAYLFKSRDNRWVQPIYHIYPNWRDRPGHRLVNMGGFYLQRFSFALIKRAADEIIVINPLMKANLTALGFDSTRITVSGCALDLENIAKARPSDSLRYDAVFLGRLFPSKGIFDLPLIWKEVCRAVPEAQLAIIGGGDTETARELATHFSKHHLDNNVHLLGYLDAPSVYGLLKTARVFLTPSHEEGWGMAIAEAMACHLPVIAWDLPVYQSIFGDNLLRLRENDFAGFAEAAIRLLKDKTLHDDFAKRGAMLAQTFSWEAVARAEISVMNKMKMLD